jgi:hypothetical protein
MSTRKLISRAMEFLEELGSNASAQEKQEVLDVLFDALLFIESTGQLYAFEDYRKHLVSDDPPGVLAAFGSREEAETWLKEHPEPPSSAYVLIADQYHLLVYNRELQHRHVFPHPVLEYFLGERVREGLPPPVASFATREEAEAWFKSVAAPPTQAVILIAGEPHLAVHHSNIRHRSIYPFSMAVEGEAPDTPQDGPGGESAG